MGRGGSQEGPPAAPLRPRADQHSTEPSYDELARDLLQSEIEEAFATRGTNERSPSSDLITDATVVYFGLYCAFHHQLTGDTVTRRGFEKAFAKTMRQVDREVAGPGSETHRGWDLRVD